MTAGPAYRCGRGPLEYPSEVAALRVGDMHRTRTSGFTLVELMVTIAIVAILLALGLPSFQGAMRSNRVATANNELLASIALARSEAIRSTRSAGMCAANATGTACGTDWNLGWLIWANDDTTRTYQPAQDTLLRYVQPRTRLAFTVADSNATNATEKKQIYFDNRGRPVDNPLAGRTISLQPDDCPSGSNLKRSLTLNSSGHVNSKKDSCS